MSLASFNNTEKEKMRITIIYIHTMVKCNINLQINKKMNINDLRHYTKILKGKKISK